MLQIKDKPITTALQAKSILDRHTAKYGIPIDLDKCLDYISYCREVIRVKEHQWQRMAGIPGLSYTKRNDVRSVLINKYNVPEELLTHKGKVGVNKDTIPKVLNSDYVSEDAKAFITIYQEISKLGYLMSYLGQYLQGPLTDVETFDGHRMVLAKPRWEVLATGRISASEPSLQNLTKVIGDILTAPKGTILLRADSGQIEPRITYSEYIKDPLLKALIIAYNDAYYGMLHFITMTAEEELIIRFRENYFYDGFSMVWNGVMITSDSQCPVPIKSAIELPLKEEVTEEMAEGRKKIKLYLLAGNYGGNLRAKFPGDKLAEAFMNKIQNHPLRLKLQAEIDRNVDRGQEVFYTAFGNPIKPDDADNKKYDKIKDPEGWLGHLKRCGFNNPIQGTASDLMCDSVYEADKIITRESKGVSFISYYKHDEGCFIIDEKDSHLVDKLKEVTAYQVRDWIPIYADAEIGKVGGTPEWFEYSYTGKKQVVV